MKSFLPAILLSFVFVACASKGTNSSSGAPKMDANTETASSVETKTETKVQTKAEKKARKAKVAHPESSATTAASAEPTSATEAICKAGTDERKLAIVAKDTGCELQYTKAGQTSTIASQIIGNVKCESVMTNIKEKLIAAGYTCN